MNDFWAIVLGAGLATFGGIISFLFTNFIERRNKIKDEKQSKRIETYINMLTFLHTVKFTVCSQEGIMERLAQVTAQGALYASVEAKKAYDNVIEVIIELSETLPGTDSWEKTIDKANAFIDLLTSIIKKEICFEDENSKKLLKIMNKKEENK